MKKRIVRRGCERRFAERAVRNLPGGITNALIIPPRVESKDVTPCGRVRALAERHAVECTGTSLPKSVERRPRASTPSKQFRALYEQALEYFGQVVDEIGES